MHVQSWPPARADYGNPDDSQKAYVGDSQDARSISRSIWREPGDITDSPCWDAEAAVCVDDPCLDEEGQCRQQNWILVADTAGGHDGYGNIKAQDQDSDSKHQPWNYNRCCMFLMLLWFIAGIASVILWVLARPGTSTKTPASVLPPETQGPSDCKALHSSSVKRGCCEKYGGPGCTATTTSETHDCGAWDSHWQEWSNPKKLWCCRNSKDACQKMMNATTNFLNTYNCKLDESNPEGKWPITKKMWCCINYNRGCTTQMTSEPYDCNAGYSKWKSEWTPRKQRWCCKQYSVGCAMTTTVHYNCTVQHSNSEQGWTHLQKKWCCEHFSHGCLKTMTQDPYDCQAGYAHWHGWSRIKRHFCCDNYKLGCLTTSLTPSMTSAIIQQPTAASELTTEYNCLAGYSNWRNLWTVSKAKWCCKKNSRGCLTSDA